MCSLDNVDLGRLFKIIPSIVFYLMKQFVTHRRRVEELQQEMQETEDVFRYRELAFFLTRWVLSTWCRQSLWPWESLTMGCSLMCLLFRSLFLRRWLKITGWECVSFLPCVHSQPQLNVDVLPPPPPSSGLWTRGRQRERWDGRLPTWNKGTEFWHTFLRVFWDF